jgi:hypothetical protein
VSFGGIVASLRYLDDLYIPDELSISYDKIDGDVSPSGVNVHSVLLEMNVLDFPS